MEIDRRRPPRCMFTGEERVLTKPRCYTSSSNQQHVQREMDRTWGRGHGGS